MTRILRVVLAVVVVVQRVVLGVLCRVTVDSSDWDDRIGICPGSGLTELDDAALAALMDAVAASGAAWVRIDVDWSVVEGERGQWNWTRTDRVLAAATARGLRVLALLTNTPDWARAADTSSHAPPEDVADFGRFAEAAAQRLGGQVEAWEIWNEPNSALFWEPRADPVRYAALLGAASDAVRAWSSAPVLTGGLAPAHDDGSDIAPVTFLQGLYAAGAAGAFDGVAVHPYSYPALPSDTDTAGYNLFQQLPAVHDVLLRHGDGSVRLWLTEFGAPTGHGRGAVSPDRQVQILTDGLALARHWPWVGPVFVYSLRDRGTDGADRAQNFGVLTVDWQPKPAWEALRTATGRRR